MPYEAKVAVLPKEGEQLRIQSVKIPDPKATEVVVRLHASGICHSQLHQIHAARNNEVLLGHEATGTIEAIGDQVEHVEEGDEVLVTWVPRQAAVDGRPATWMTLEMPDASVATCQNIFTWADRSIMDSQYVIKITGQKYDRQTASIIGCAVMTGYGAVVNSAGAKANQSVAVFGVGGVGLSAIAGAKKVGANPIIAVDLDDDKLQMARNFGATHVINGKKENPVEAIHALTPGGESSYTFLQSPVSGADFALDCIGLSSTTEQALRSVRAGQFGVGTGGVAVLVGIPQKPLEINLLEMVITEKRLIGSMAGSCKPDRDLPEILRLAQDGNIDLGVMVTERFSLDQVNEAVAALDAGEISGRAIFVYD